MRQLSRGRGLCAASEPAAEQHSVAVRRLAAPAPRPPLRTAAAALRRRAGAGRAAAERRLPRAGGSAPCWRQRRRRRRRQRRRRGQGQPGSAGAGHCAAVAAAAQPHRLHLHRQRRGHGLRPAAGAPVPGRAHRLLRGRPRAGRDAQRQPVAGLRPLRLDAGSQPAGGSCARVCAGVLAGTARRAPPPPPPPLGGAWSASTPAVPFPHRWCCRWRSSSWAHT